MTAGHPDHLQAAILAKEAIRFRLKKRAKTEERFNPINRLKGKRNETIVSK